jgi:hypothetical protein
MGPFIGEALARGKCARLNTGTARDVPTLFDQHRDSGSVVEESGDAVGGVGFASGVEAKRLVSMGRVAVAGAVKVKRHLTGRGVIAANGPAQRDMQHQDESSDHKPSDSLRISSLSRAHFLSRRAESHSALVYVERPIVISERHEGRSTLLELGFEPGAVPLEGVQIPRSARLAIDLASRIGN